MGVINKILKRTLLFLVALSVFSATVGLIYQSISQANDLKRFPPPGRMLEVDGRMMHIHCQGVGSPTVLIEQGLGFYSSAWENLNSKIAVTSRVCAYDRVGMGYSEPIGRSLTNSEVVSRLYKLLGVAGETDDLVLVGQSAGGIYIRDFQREYPERVVGMVFVDSSHEQQTSRLPALPAGAPANNMATLMEIAQYFAPFGIFRATGLIEGQVDALSIEESLREKLLAQYHFSHSISAQLTETKGFRENLQLERAPTIIGDIPITVITQGAPVVLPQNSPEYLTLEFFQEQRKVLIEMHEELAALSTNSEHVFATKSGHSIHYDEPELVVNSIVEVVERARVYRELKSEF